MSTAVVVGNPRPASRTLAAATLLAGELTGTTPDPVVDLATVGAGLLELDDPGTGRLVEQVEQADVVVFACPTYKGTYTGLLKLFLDRFEARPRPALAVPLMLGAGPGHSLAAELTLRPVLAELGFTTVRGLYVLDSQHDDPAAHAAWLEQVRPVVSALHRSGASA